MSPSPKSISESENNPPSGGSHNNQYAAPFETVTISPGFTNHLEDPITFGIDSFSTPGIEKNVVLDLP
jgi:hypothetical protein